MTSDAAVVEQVNVALPVSDAADSVIVFGAVKFVPGVPKLQVGGSTAPLGSLVTEKPWRQCRRTNYCPVTVMRQFPEPPGAEIVIVELVQPAVGALMPCRSHIYCRWLRNCDWLSNCCRPDTSR